MKMSYSELKHSVMILLKHIQEYKCTRDKVFNKYISEIDGTLRCILKKRLLLHVADKKGKSNRRIAMNANANNACSDDSNDLWNEYGTVLSG